MFQLGFCKAINANWSPIILKKAERRLVSFAFKSLLIAKEMLFASNNNSQLDISDKHIKPPILLIYEWFLKLLI